MKVKVWCSEPQCLRAHSTAGARDSLLKADQANLTVTSV